MNRISPVVDLEALSDANLVIEAAVFKTISFSRFNWFRYLFRNYGYSLSLIERC